jgi:vacuolar-type H+-ATPase subunit H
MAALSSNPIDRKMYDHTWFQARRLERDAREEIETSFNADSPMPNAIESPATAETTARTQEEQFVLLSLLNDLEQELLSGRSIPMTSKVVLERDSLLGLIDQLREMLPKTILEAEQIRRRETEIIEDARNRATQFVARAQHDADSMIEEERIVIKARERAQQIIQEAEDEGARVRGDATAVAERIRQDADQDVELVYQTLTMNLERILQQLKGGK